jgi:TrmH family RNA methyltransferase
MAAAIPPPTKSPPRPADRHPADRLEHPAMKPPRLVTSRQHPLLRQLARLTQDPGAYRRLGQVWLEGEHLGLALRARGLRAATALVGEAFWQRRPDLAELALGLAEEVVLLPEALWSGFTTVETPVALGFLLPLDALRPAEPPGLVDSVVLDRLQDPGNVGAILRSAAALGVRQVIALKGTAALWSPKVLRAGMGAHFALALHEAQEAQTLHELAGRGLALLATSSHGAQALHAVALPRPCAWLLGHEGQGVDPALAAQAALTLTIPQPGGEESLNVAAAAAICFYEAARQRLVGVGADAARG